MNDLKETLLVDEINFVKLTGLKRRIMLIMNNNKKWISPTEIQMLLDRGYRNGTIDRSFDFNTICIMMRTLHSQGLLDKRTTQETHGRRSIYYINLFGIEQLKKNLQGFSYEKNMAKFKENIRRMSKKIMNNNNIEL